VDFAPSVKGALYLMHDPGVQGLLKPESGNLVDRLSAMSDSEKAAKALFLAVFSRRPTLADRELVGRMLGKTSGTARAEAIGQLAWALLASTEFCVNH